MVMIHIPTHPLVHYPGDILAWIAASLAGWWQHRAFPRETERLAQVTPPGYYVALALGGVVGAWLAGSLNTVPSGLAPSHSIAGALAGAIVGVEGWKWLHGVRGSTGGAFVLPVAVGIMVGRWGCLFAGLADQTYGVPTDLPWGVDLGDGIPRHPVEIYESLSMALFLLAYVPARLRGRAWARDHGFHAFVIVYGAQRFLWEFLKPYPKLIGPFNLFHLICGGLIAYGFVWWRNGGVRADHGAQGSALSVSQPDDEPVRNLP
ncbi:prolipoprotein diacylglyceryl transferase [Novosphingobium nitrogenifigens DSM 19370]|uniref:Prolipoprotein diacylglyceryl transferase n=2 Tax=Novosphingobium nitrogenifigens TaxID=378548 RepID=F1ZCF7_9SPHN|nr:prolipoprotein diacylglyceryl transferase family protein [Novosphingobium nitrogenifigens]EGD57761.1 prolipoprotein diacylglyceryl transferase [Novosphingobium nitrogenifigens DSM 19370]